MLSQVALPPSRLVATEQWPPNVEIAARNLASFGVWVVEAAEGGGAALLSMKPSTSAASRHPVVTIWDS